MERRVTIKDIWDELREEAVEFSFEIDEENITPGAELTELGEFCETPVTSVTYDSKQVRDGSLFVCKGAHFKEEYLREAIESGAVSPRGNGPR